MRERAGYIPDIGTEQFELKTMVFEGKNKKLEVEIPLLTNEQMNLIIDKVKKSSAEVLKGFKVSEILDIVDRVIEKLLDRNSAFRKKAEELLPIVTGYDREMIGLGLTSYLKNFRKPQLQRFLAEDFPNPLVLDEFQPQVKRGFSKAVGPDLILHIWAGNVPALPLWSLISGLLVKSGTIGKTASAEPLFAGWFAQLLTEMEPRLADCLAVVWWKGGDEEREKLVLRKSDAIVAYGSNYSLESLAKRVPITSRFLPFGHKISFGIVSNISLDSRKAWDTAHRAALDVVRYDQQGCYSPHLFYIQKGGAVSPQEFARFLANELDNFEKRYPRRSLSLEEESEIAAWRNSAELSLYTDESKELIGNSNHSWTVVYEGESGHFSPVCLNRTVKVIPYNDPAEILFQIAPHRRFLQTVGVACSPAELFEMAKGLTEAGVTRITGLGSMASPEPGWHHDGRFSLADLVQMVDIEHSAEELAEIYAPYLD